MTTSTLESFTPYSSDNRTYSEAVTLLNSLQTNAATLNEIRKYSSPAHANTLALPEMIEFVRRIGYEVDDFNRLGLIHITGTKGKGSTGAFVENMLRCSQNLLNHQPIKTGLYTSPHLSEVRERIRINGKPLDRDTFAKYFFQVWDRLIMTKAEAVAQNKPALPQYFRFLTCLALHVFSCENTNATILEVGIGGMYDSTNIITRPIVTGITSLGYDHVTVLGRTLTDIGRQKAGIMKPNVPCLTIPQPVEGMKVLVEYAEKINAPLILAAPLPSHQRLGLCGVHQRLNGALALALVQVVLSGVQNIPPIERNLITLTPKTLICQAKLLPPYLNNTCHEMTLNHHELVGRDLTNIGNGSNYDNEDEDKTPYDMQVYQAKPIPIIPSGLSKGLESVTWPGRAQIITSKKYPTLEFFVDGAHTTESIRACVTWYRGMMLSPMTSTSSMVTNSSDIKGFHLIFNVTHGRDPTKMLQLLVNLPWHTVCFTTNESGVQLLQYDKDGNDTTNYNDPIDPELGLQKDMQHMWLTMTKMTPDRVHVTSTVTRAVQRIEQDKTVSEGRQAVLVTGSLYLVGALFDVLEKSVQ